MIRSELILIAHRGLCGRCPENTLKSFRAALSAGARGVEFDVQQTRDGELVVIHDVNLKRLAGVDRDVGDLTFRELRALDVGSGQRVPRLSEVLRLVGGLAEIHLEIKQAAKPYPGIERRILEAVGTPQRRNVIFSSFDFSTLRRLRGLRPRARIGWLAGPGSRAAEIRRAVSLKAESIHISRRRISAAWVKEAAAEGLKVLVYTANAESLLRRLEGFGVYGAFTDFVDLGAARQEALR